jgi:DNA modification methylase
MLIHGDCVEVMAGMDPESVDAIVCDPPYGLEFMGKEWDRLDTGHNAARWSGRRTAADAPERDPETPGGRHGARTSVSQPNPKCGTCGHYRFSSKPCECEVPAWVARPNEQSWRMQEWHARWAEAAYRVAKPSAYLLAFGGTRTVHRMTVALEDAGWIIRDMLVWGYASGFPKSKASLKPAWEPIVMARKPGPLRMLAIDECRIPIDPSDPVNTSLYVHPGVNNSAAYGAENRPAGRSPMAAEGGRWPANIVLTDPIFDGGVEGVVGGGEVKAGVAVRAKGGAGAVHGIYGRGMGAYPEGSEDVTYGDSGTYSRFFLVPKAARADREPVLGGLPAHLTQNGQPTGAGPVTRQNVHPTVKPTDLMRHLVRLVTPAGGVVLDPFLGSGTTALAAEMEGFEWIGIEREAEYVAIAEARLNGTQRGLGLEAS